MHAGAASFDARWATQPGRFKLARRLRFAPVAMEHGPNRQLGGWVMAVLQTMRLVRAAKVWRPICKVTLAHLDRSIWSCSMSS